MPGMSNPKKRKHSAAVSSKKKVVTSAPKKQKSSVAKGIEIPEQVRRIEDQDVESFAGNELGDISFLTRLDQKELTRRVEKEKGSQVQKPRKQPLATTTSGDEYSDDDDLEENLNNVMDEDGPDERNWNEEQEYEQKVRQGDSIWRRKESTRLPVRSAQGSLLPVGQDSSSESSDESEESDSEGEEETTKDEVAETPASTKSLTLIEAKESLAKLAEELVEAPEEKISNLKSIQEIFNKGHAAIKKLAIITQLTIYKDIIPGYRIRPVTEAEKTTKISKEVRQLRDFEDSLLISYKRYLTSLTSIIQSARKDDSLKSLSLVAVTAIGRLLVTVPHFNFRTELLQVITQQLSRRTEDEAFRKCKEAIVQLFEEDEEGRASLEAVTMISKIAKKRHYLLHPSVIQTLSHLRLLTELDFQRSMVSTPDPPRIKKKNRIFRTKRARKDLKSLQKVQKDLEEGEAQVSAEERERLQSETLKLVFSLYFRVLKETSRENAVLSVTLEGIAQFARLINADFFGDLLEVMRELLESWDEDEEGREGLQIQGFWVREKLVCLGTVFTLLANQGGLNIDLQYFIQRFHSLLPFIPFSPSQLADSPSSSNEKSLLELSLKIIDAILFTSPTAPRKADILLFYKCILSNTLHMEEKEAMIFNKVLQKMKGRFDKKLEGIWDAEGVSLGAEDMGKRRIMGWESGLLERHYCPGVGQGVKALRREESTTS